jgi:hypothetical protein
MAKEQIREGDDVFVHDGDKAFGAVRDRQRISLGAQRTYVDVLVRAFC